MKQTVNTGATRYSDFRWNWFIKRSFI